VIRGLALAAVAFLAGSSGPGVHREVLIPGKFFSPQREVVLIGDTVTWQNGDSSAHTVTADDVSFDSGTVVPGTSFSRTFSSAGIYTYHCTIHRYMHGEVDVYGLALSAPGYAVPIGEQTALRGLAPPDVGSAILRRRGPDGSFVDVGTSPVAADGSFRYPLTAETPGVYQAIAGSLTSGQVTLAVAARLKLIAARSKHGATLVVVRSDPPQPRARVELQAYVYERFDFLPLRRARLDAQGSARFRVGARHQLHLRALLPNGVDGYGRAVSPTILVRPPASR
jgi:plastocyanin